MLRRLPSRNWNDLDAIALQCRGVVSVLRAGCLVPHEQNAAAVSCSYFSSSHWFFACIVLMLRPSPMSQFLSQKSGHQPLSHWNQWKFSVTKVLRIQGEEEGPLPKSFSPSFADFTEQDLKETKKCPVFRRDLLPVPTFNSLRSIGVTFVSQTG